MVIGVGIDLIEIDRIRNAMTNNPRFVYRILTDRERDYCRTPQQVAGRWAAKEAIAKAVGLSLRWHQVEILPDELGQPVASVRSVDFDPARLRLKISITHERTHAAAVAILERLVLHKQIY
jgi:holo-[acyl-carrier protein] synthase